MILLTKGIPNQHLSTVSKCQYGVRDGMKFPIKQILFILLCRHLLIGILLLRRLPLYNSIINICTDFNIMTIWYTIAKKYKIKAVASPVQRRKAGLVLQCTTMRKKLAPDIYRTTRHLSEISLLISPSYKVFQKVFQKIHRAYNYTISSVILIEVFSLYISQHKCCHVHSYLLGTDVGLLKLTGLLKITGFHYCSVLMWILWTTHSFSPQERGRSLGGPLSISLSIGCRSKNQTQQFATTSGPVLSIGVIG